ncbi:MAG: hypothetical protein AAF609_22340 [Cyanobacteria bacterium P01_C01_bin.120]
MTIIWSSYYPDEINKIPNIGHLVTYYYEQRPFVVEARVIEKGNVSLKIRHNDEVIERERLEVLNWYPEVGDICVCAAKPYLDWQRAYRNYVLPEWTFKAMELLEIQGRFALVRPRGKNQQRRKLPFACLRVLEKNLGQ